MEGLAPGRHSIEAQTPEGGNAKLEDVDIEKAGLLRLVVETSRTAVLTGRVTGLPPAVCRRGVARGGRCYGGLEK